MTRDEIIALAEREGFPAERALAMLDRVAKGNQCTPEQVIVIAADGTLHIPAMSVNADAARAYATRICEAAAFADEIAT